MKRYRMTLGGAFRDDDGDWVEYKEVAEIGEDSREMFKAGFLAGIRLRFHPDMDKELAERYLQHAWKKHCGIDT